NVRNYVSSAIMAPATAVKRNLESGCFPVRVAAPQTGATIESHTFEWAVRAQFILSTQSQTLHFPAPAVKDPIRFGPEYAQADFTTTHRPFWADEHTHKAQ
ncbi:hypothetical protein ACCD10_32740, partial [Pseudomonas sp. Pseusp122]